MVKNIDAQLDNFNIQSKFDDTNLVSKTIVNIANKEKIGLNALRKAFTVYLFIVFTTKFINESILAFFGLNLIYIKIERKDSIEEIKNNVKTWIVPTFLGCAYLMVLLVELLLAKKNKFTQDKILLIFILLFNVINSALFIFPGHIYYKFLIVISILEIILSNIIGKTASHYFINIIPNYYLTCKIPGNILINMLSTLGRIISCVLLIYYDRPYCFEFEVIFYSVMTGLSFISCLLYLIFYKEIRVKAISRVIGFLDKDEVKVVSED